MKKRILAILLTICALSVQGTVFAEETEKEYAYLEDMSIKELRELRSAINKLLGDEEEVSVTSVHTEQSVDKETQTESVKEVKEIPSDDLTYSGWEIHLTDYKVKHNGQTGGDDIVFHFNCTNNSSNTGGVGHLLSATAFQNGIGLHAPSIYMGDVGDVDRYTRIQPGTTVSVAFAFQLYNKEDDVTLELNSNGLFSSVQLRKVVELK